MLEQKKTFKKNLTSTEQKIKSAVKKTKTISNNIGELAKEHAPKAFARLLELLESKDERLALAVVQEILNRAYGKAESARDKRDEEGQATVVVIRDGCEANLPKSENQIESIKKQEVKTKDTKPRKSISKLKSVKSSSDATPLLQ